MLQSYSNRTRIQYIGNERINDTDHKILTYVEYRAVSGVFCIDPPPPLHPASVSSPPHQRRGYTRAGRWGGGGSIFWKTPDIWLASYSVIPPLYWCSARKGGKVQKLRKTIKIKDGRIWLSLRRWTWTGDFKCREVKTGFYRNRSMQTGSSGTLIGWKSGQTTFVPLWDWMEGAWLRTLNNPDVNRQARQ